MCLSYTQINLVLRSLIRNFAAESKTLPYLMIRDLLFVMTGGAAGAALRYGIGLGLHGAKWGHIPLATLAVNLLGCLLLGLLMGIGERYSVLPRQVLLMLTVGVCGAFTTFSTFAADASKALWQGHTLATILYVLLSCVGGILLFMLGHFLATR